MIKLEWNHGGPRFESQYRPNHGGPSHSSVRMGTAWQFMNIFNKNFDWSTWCVSSKFWNGILWLNILNTLWKIGKSVHLFFVQSHCILYKIVSSVHFLNQIKVLRYVHMCIPISFRFEDHFIGNLLLYPHAVELFKLLRLFSEASHYFLNMFISYNTAFISEACVNYFDAVLALRR